jgi:beta-glucosidase-like glycosyl hydrolase
LRCYSDADGIKAMIAKELTKLELSRNDMVKSLDIALDMTNEQLENIIKSLSKNQLKTKFGQALKMIVALKEENHL